MSMLQRHRPVHDTIVKAAGEPIPTLYGGTSFHRAAMETVFRDVPFAAGSKTYAAGLQRDGGDALR
ncbi:MAG: hypothetical protein LH480_15395 [Rubrivivax sp.]|nr:hypothetical protein [Rubrivivax sp.]